MEAEGTTRAFSSKKYPDGYEKGKVYPKKDLTAEMFIFTAPSDLKYDGNPKNAVVNSKDDISYGEITIQYYKNGAKIEGVPINTGTYTVKIDVAGNKDYNAISDLTDESWTFTITHEHKYQYMHDDTEHWQQCTVPGCVYSINREKHSGGTASCTKKAICTTCKIEYGEIDSQNHVNVEHHELKPATCAVPGVAEYYSCSRCDAISADATFKVEKLGHSFTNYVYNNDATYEKDGTETAKCDRCDATDTRRKEGTKLVAAPVTYKIIEGADGTYTINADGTYTIRANGEFSKFVSVEMDGKVVDSKNYTAKSGSTIITFSKEYMSSLSAGKHTVKVNFTDGSAETTLTVAQKDTKDTGKTDVGKKSVSKSAKTGDNSNLIAWFILLVASVCILGSLRAIRRQRRR